MATQM